MLHHSKRHQGRNDSRIARQGSSEGIRCSSQGSAGSALDRPDALKAICLTNPPGFHPPAQPEPEPKMKLTNKVEDKIIRLCVAAFDEIDDSLDHQVYDLIARISEAIMELHWTEGIDRDLIVSEVITQLEQKGVEVSY